MSKPVIIEDPLANLPEAAQQAALAYLRDMRQLVHPDLVISGAEIHEDGDLEVRVGVYFYASLRMSPDMDSRVREGQVRDRARELKQVMAKGVDGVIEVGTTWRRKDESRRYVLTQWMPASAAGETRVVLIGYGDPGDKLEITVDELREDWTRRAR